MSSMAVRHGFFAVIFCGLVRPLVSLNKKLDSFMGTNADPCDIKFALDFSTSVSSSNLGGQGPDFDSPAAIIYENVIPFLGFVDLEVTVASGTYTPGNPAVNGLFHSFGIVNVRANTSVNLKFRFIDHSTRQGLNNPSPFYFSIFDLDIASRNRGVESVSMKKFLSYKTADDTEVLVMPSGEYSKFVGQKVGRAEDNPTNPNSLTMQQMARTVSILVPAGSEFEMTFQVESSGVGGARNFLFAGPSTLVCPFRSLCSSFTCPSGELKEDATYITCAGETCVSDDTPTCCCSPESFAPFHPPDLSEKSIGERIDGKIILGNILAGAPVDMEVTAANDFSQINTKDSGLPNSFGILSAMAGSSVQFNFKFKNRINGYPWMLPPFRMSVLDLDHSAGTECKEEIFVLGSTNFTLEPDSTVAVAYKNELTHFASGEVGGRADNPVDDLSREQKRKSVTFEFPPSTEFSLTFLVGSRCKHSRSIGFTKPTFLGRC